MSGIKNKASPEGGAAQAYRICPSVSGLIDRTFLDSYGCAG
jgi:hypothetical protein